MSPVNIKARNYPKGQFQNAFPEDEFMSMANTGRASNRTWNKSFVPSTEDLAARQQLGEEAMDLGDEQWVAWAPFVRQRATFRR